MGLVFVPVSFLEVPAGFRSDILVAGLGINCGGICEKLSLQGWEREWNTLRRPGHSEPQVVHA